MLHSPPQCPRPQLCPCSHCIPVCCHDWGWHSSLLHMAVPWHCSPQLASHEHLGGGDTPRAHPQGLSDTSEGSSGVWVMAMPLWVSLEGAEDSHFPRLP